ncbi:hypothetical protein GQR58_022013 [Nymphon striatum]|nr:hypothetical protein GQR58_022013 [Nymphon striatum]
MTFDTDILVKSHWEGINTDFIDTKVIYIEDNVSHFHYLRDNLLLIKLHTAINARINSVDEKQSSAEVFIDKETPFYEKGFGVPACIGLEFMGQTAALIAGNEGT